MEDNENNATSENTKTFSQEEVDKMLNDLKAKNEAGFQKKLDKAIARKMRGIEEENFKKDQLIDVLKQQTKRTTIDSLLDMSEKQYGIKIPRNKTTNKEDLQVLAEHDANEFIEDGKEVVNEEINRLANRTRNDREEEVYNRLNNFLEEQEASNKKQKELEEIKEIGFDKEVVDSDEFKDFRSKFNEETPLKDIAEMYEKVNDKPFNPGSAKDIVTKGTDEFYTLDEFNALTKEDFDKPGVYEKAMKSMSHFYNK